ncbi:hypothetical protein PR048_009566 [Dryococelus australis]|uniref:Uncharacterized protein n=1 Tax=Dryococelus australis TaxID=614101 RepID=A0ABQ9I083_9NEOP|nr:hypothetical protein PR048_009566 [Dryococelus australis]
MGRNKQQLIKLISQEMLMFGCKVFQAEGDTDVDITRAAVISAQENSTTLIGEDTNLLVLLLHYAELYGKPLYFKSDNQSRCIPKVFNINNLKSILGSELCIHLFFLHAFTGCDSISRIYGVSKKTVLPKLLNGDRVLHSCVSAFTLPGKNSADIISLGSQAMAVIFGAKSTSSLATLRYQTLMKKVVTAKSFVHPERLPPTESSTKFHCLRVDYQTMMWTSRAREMNPVN